MEYKLKDPSIEKQIQIICDRLKRLEGRVVKTIELQVCIQKGHMLVSRFERCLKIEPSLENHTEQMELVQLSFESYREWMPIAQRLTKGV